MSGAITRQHLERELRRRGSKQKAVSSAWFFKTAKGQYGYGDRFLGVTVPQQRVVAKQFRALPLTELSALLKSPYHEHRLTAAIILTLQFKKADAAQQKTLVEFFLRHTACFNNWDIVDTVAPAVLGTYLLDHPRTVLVRLAKSKNIWERRIAIVSTQALIRHNEFNDTMKIATLLLTDSHDLIHKATGWMLREVGDRDRAELEKFLRQHAVHMPRTMLRYAIEKFPEPKRRSYLARQAKPGK